PPTATGRPASLPRGHGRTAGRTAAQQVSHGRSDLGGRPIRSQGTESNAGRRRRWQRRPSGRPARHTMLPVAEAVAARLAPPPYRPRPRGAGTKPGSPWSGPVWVRAAARIRSTSARMVARARRSLRGTVGPAVVQEHPDTAETASSLI